MWKWKLLSRVFFFFFLKLNFINYLKWFDAMLFVVSFYLSETIILNRNDVQEKELSVGDMIIFSICTCIWCDDHGGSSLWLSSISIYIKFPFFLLLLIIKIIIIKMVVDSIDLFKKKLHCNHSWTTIFFKWKEIITLLCIFSRDSRRMIVYDYFGSARILTLGWWKNILSMFVIDASSVCMWSSLPQNCRVCVFLIFKYLIFTFSLSLFVIPLYIYLYYRFLCCVIQFIHPLYFSTIIITTDLWTI